MRTRTFGELRWEVIRRVGLSQNLRSWFSFRHISPRHEKFWDEMNEVEYRRGYVRGEYEKPDTPALHEMKLLAEDEFEMWLKKFEAISKMRKRRS